MLPLLVVYVAGVAIGLWRVDATLFTRVIVALLWPLGLAAAVITISGLVLATMVLFPLVGTLSLAAAALIWYLAR